MFLFSQQLLVVVIFYTLSLTLTLVTGMFYQQLSTFIVFSIQFVCIAGSILMLGPMHWTPSQRILGPRLTCIKLERFFFPFFNF